MRETRKLRMRTRCPVLYGVTETPGVGREPPYKYIVSHRQKNTTFFG